MCDKQGSRLWQKLVVAVDEETRQQVVTMILSTDEAMLDMSLDPFGNFTLQSLINAVTSSQLVS
jgi:hypothetical protein